MEHICIIYNKWADAQFKQLLQIDKKIKLPIEEWTKQEYTSHKQED